MTICTFLLGRKKVMVKERWEIITEMTAWGLEFVWATLKNDKTDTYNSLSILIAIIWKSVSVWEMFKSQMLMIIIITELTLLNLKGLLIILNGAIQKVPQTTPWRHRHCSKGCTSRNFVLKKRFFYTSSLTLPCLASCNHLYQQQKRRQRSQQRNSKVLPN